VAVVPAWGCDLCRFCVLLWGLVVLFLWCVLGVCFVGMFIARLRCVLLFVVVYFRVIVLCDERLGVG